MEKLAYTYDEAGESSGYGKTTIKEAVLRGDLIASYANTHPVIDADELKRWIKSLPHEPVRRPKKRAA